MIPLPAESARPQGRSTLRLLVLCTLLAAPIIIGLLSMHTLSMHGSPAAMPAHTALHATVSAHEAMAEMSTGPEHAGPAADSAEAEAGASAHRLSTSATVDSTGSMGGTDGLGTALTCVLALLLVGLCLALPGLRPRWLHSSQRPGLFAPMRSAGTAPPRPPSLVALCISRT